MKIIKLFVFLSSLFIIGTPSSFCQWNDTQTNDNVGIGTSISSNYNLSISNASSTTDQRNIYSYMKGGGAKYGIYSFLTSGGAKFGFFARIAPVGGGDKFGYYSNLSNTHSTSTGRSYGFYANLTSDKGPGKKYGIYTALSGTGTGTRYGIYAHSPETSDFAGYFNGNLHVNTGVLTVGAPNLVEDYKVIVDGKALFEEVMVLESGLWPDYVFDDGYQLKSLEEVEAYINQEGHLPGIPSAEEVDENGLLLGNMQRLTVEKIEEMTLYMLTANKQIKALQAKNAHLEAQLNKLIELVENK